MKTLTEKEKAICAKIVIGLVGIGLAGVVVAPFLQRWLFFASGLTVIALGIGFFLLVAVVERRAE